MGYVTVCILLILELLIWDIVTSVLYKYGFVTSQMTDKKPTKKIGFLQGGLISACFANEPSELDKASLDAYHGSCKLCNS